ncbi:MULTISPECIES: methylated-DNA--[protein]-cysteine S-methyltransferase [Chitinophaga]|uniref:methylated-DNA--[protein]-cysteine S-methyltransferase n=1 Tax=Chitinophaga TaxID=79328 RepID=UPI000DB912F9|nr:methylated-DNA--[protein]-cysteine S-methyltransferase [Chitinophaga ginsengisegetis]MDR6566096.1 methylated-DNA-[protein]-cysteine S-methyltransferase [Chitinophaga ginsengisegetis]MDR6645825.1 methylated-DNA-[protein]-cysteine S-methyltransferase [Chitinophaga ginsengisegetis]MDR6651583.1 methylated-DNA-[protein]-cysteine S-methyltransferase [Chitinophaga ginsengisegetis]
MTYYHKTMDSPVGQLTLIASDKGLAAVLWENELPDRVNINAGTIDIHHPILCQAEEQLNEYFAKKRTSFSVELDFVGTAFQKKIWKALLTIPFGETRTYGQIAKQIGDPKAVRAVGGAANKNPISIIAPCHRVIGASGKLVGFAGGIATKNRLLQLENKVSPTLF